MPSVTHSRSELKYDKAHTFSTKLDPDRRFSKTSMSFVSLPACFSSLALSFSLSTRPAIGRYASSPSCWTVPEKKKKKNAERSQGRQTHEHKGELACHVYGAVYGSADKKSFSELKQHVGRGRGRGGAESSATCLRF